jgi:hypothetical protein
MLTNEPSQDESLRLGRLDALEPNEVKPGPCGEDDIENVPSQGGLGQTSQKIGQHRTHG